MDYSSITSRIHPIGIRTIAPSPWSLSRVYFMVDSIDPNRPDSICSLNRTSLHKGLPSQGEDDSVGSGPGSTSDKSESLDVVAGENHLLSTLGELIVYPIDFALGFRGSRELVSRRRVDVWLDNEYI
jgi:hypothetical protein